MRFSNNRYLDGLLAALTDDVVAEGRAPREVAEFAARATAAALGDAPSAGLARRADAYFRAVVRRRVLRQCAGTPAAARVVVDAVVSDLLQAGRSAADAWEELGRGWGHLLTPELSEEVRTRLCA